MKIVLIALALFVGFAFRGGKASGIKAAGATDSATSVTVLTPNIHIKGPQFSLDIFSTSILDMLGNILAKQDSASANYSVLVTDYSCDKDSLSRQKRYDAIVHYMEKKWKSDAKKFAYRSKLEEEGWCDGSGMGISVIKK